MPELPEVETTVRGLQPHLEHTHIDHIKVFNPSLRWPVSQEIIDLKNQPVLDLFRRGKYIVMSLPEGFILFHLGMSGSMRVINDGSERLKHDHIELLADNGTIVRFNDPRRFGCALWADRWQSHPLIEHLGPEPLSEEFNADYLHKLSRGKKSSIKQFIMNSQIVVGVGNIYANEALFLSGIRPTKQSGKVSKNAYIQLTANIKKVLQSAITQGGTTLRDFVNSDGKPGYFKQQLYVYGRKGQACKICSTVLKEKRQNNRSTVYCPSCQS